MKRNQIRIEPAIRLPRCLPLSLRSRLSRFDSFSEVDKLAGIRLEELAVELGVPLGKGTIDEEPLVPEDDNTGPVLWPSNPGWPEAAVTAAAAAAFKEPDESASKPAAVELEGDIPTAERAAAAGPNIAAG